MKDQVVKKNKVQQFGGDEESNARNNSMLVRLKVGNNQE